MSPIPAPLVRTVTTLAAFFAGGALLLALESAVLPKSRPAIEVLVPSAADAADIAALVDEALLVEVGLGLGWRHDPLIADRLTRSLAEITPAGVAPLDHAEALGLHRRDPLTRARLVDNARRTLPEPASPDDATLAAWFAAHQDDFARPPRLRFEHRFTRDAARATRMLAEAGRVGEGADRGEPELTLGPNPTRSLMALAAALGPEAAAAIDAAPLNAWRAVRSPVGHHVIRVTSRLAPEVPALVAIRAEVIAAWRDARRPALHAEAMARLRASYDVTLIPTSPLASGGPP